MTPHVNRLVLTACITEVDSLRYTPAGLPALNFKLEHESEMQEAGQARQVKAQIKAIGFGAIAERLVGQDVGSSWSFKGFLATPRNGKHVVFHIEEFEKS